MLTGPRQRRLRGSRAFLAAAARGMRGPVKWQFVGPVTLGVALLRAGVAPDAAFAVAVRVRAVTPRRGRSTPSPQRSRLAATRVAGRAVVRPS